MYFIKTPFPCCQRIIVVRSADHLIPRARSRPRAAAPPPLPPLPRTPSAAEPTPLPIFPSPPQSAPVFFFSLFFSVELDIGQRRGYIYNFFLGAKCMRFVRFNCARLLLPPFVSAGN
jgi:hypothetical protein